MATIREWLTKKGFDFEKGEIIYHYVGLGQTPGWSEARSRRKIKASSKVLDFEFDCGFGGPKCPRFIAEDDNRIYFPAQYDGATWLQIIHKDMTKYLHDDIETPYPGGG